MSEPAEESVEALVDDPPTPAGPEPRRPSVDDVLATLGCLLNDEVWFERKRREEAAVMAGRGDEKSARANVFAAEERAFRAACLETAIRWFQAVAPHKDEVWKHIQALEAKRRKAERAAGRRAA